MLKQQRPGKPLNFSLLRRVHQNFDARPIFLVLQIFHDALQCLCPIASIMIIIMQNFFTRFNCLFLSITLGVSAVAVAEAPLPPAPDFTLRSTDGVNLRLYEHRGDVTVLFFWASWCGPCTMVFASTDKAFTPFAGRPLRVWNITTDQTPDAALTFRAQMGLPYPTLFDVDSSVNSAYGVTELPTTVVIDRNGRIQQRFAGLDTALPQQLQTAIKDALEKPYF
jgi:peroxiredoxin